MRRRLTRDYCVGALVIGGFLDRGRTVNDGARTTRRRPAALDRLWIDRRASRSRSRARNGSVVPLVWCTNERRCREYRPTTNASPKKKVQERKFSTRTVTGSTLPCQVKASVS